MPIVTGSHPKALASGYQQVTQTGPASEPLTESTEHLLPKANKKPPKIKKKAFSPPVHGAAFRK